MSWSPDGKHIAFASKSGKEDSIIIVDIKSGDYKKIPIPLDGVFTTAWHPISNKIVFIGHKDDASDLYVINIDTQELINLTNDTFSDFSPSWSASGDKIIFSSDRGTSKGSPDMFDIDFSQTDLFMYDFSNEKVTQITDTSYNENYPVLTKDNVLFYTADYNGVYNIFRHEMGSKIFSPITNAITGIQQIDVDSSGDKLVFSGYSERGWDLFVMNQPQDKEEKIVPETRFYSERNNVDTFEDLRFVKTGISNQESEDYSSYIFARNYRKFNDSDKDIDKQDTAIDSLRFADGYISKAYKTDFSIDYIATRASIDNLFGTRALANLAWSDVMGDHQIMMGTNLVLDLDNSDVVISYAYLKNRMNYYGTLFQQANTFSLGYSLTSDYIGKLRDYGIGFFAQYPFSKFSRIDFGGTLRSVNYEVKEFDIYNLTYNSLYTENLTAMMPMVSWVFDNTTNTYTGPNDGLKQYLTFQFSPDIGDDSVPFQTIKFDIRKYFKIDRNYSIAARLMLGKSIGDNPQRFFLGGNSQMTIFSDTQTEGRDDSGFYAERVLEYENSSLLEDIYFSEYVFPVRGSRYRERTGENVAVANFEFRFPFVNYVDVSFPARIRFGNIFGHIFVDVGAAWDSSEEFSDSALVRAKYGLSDPEASAIISTFGIGMKMFTPWALLRLDTAWDRYPNGDYSKPQYILSIGYDW